MNCMMMHSMLYFNRIFKRYNATLLCKWEWHGRWRSPQRAPVSFFFFLNGAQAVVTTKQRCSMFTWRYVNVSVWREQMKRSTSQLRYNTGDAQCKTLTATHWRKGVGVQSFLNSCRNETRRLYFENFLEMQLTRFYSNLFWGNMPKSP